MFYTIRFGVSLHRNPVTTHIIRSLQGGNNMNNKESSHNTEKDNKASDNLGKETVSSRDSIGATKDYISGDSTPSSSSHQFPWIATDPKHDSKKSAKKTNS